VRATAALQKSLPPVGKTVVLFKISHGVVSEDLVCPTEPVKVSFFLTLEPMNIFEENLDRRVDRLTWVLVALVS